MTRVEHLKAAKDMIMDVESEQEKMQGIFAFMVRVDEQSAPEYDDVKLACIVLQNLLGEARDHLNRVDHHFKEYMKKEKGENEKEGD